MSDDTITCEVASPMRLPVAVSLQRFVTSETIISALISGVLGAFFGWLGTRGDDYVSFFGVGGVAMDILVTAFLTGLILTLIVTRILRVRMRKGGLPNITEDSLPTCLRLVPNNAFLRGGVMGLSGVITVVPLIVGLFWIAGSTQFSQVDFVWIKGLYSAAFGAVFTVLVLLLTLAEEVK